MKTWSLKVIKCLAQRQRAGKEKARIWRNICQTLELVKNAQTTTQLHSSHTLVGGGNGTPLYYSCLENPMDGGAFWARVHEVAKSQTQLSDYMSIELVMPYNHLVLCRPLLLLPSVFPSIRVFSNELALCIR